MKSERIDDLSAQRKKELGEGEERQSQGVLATWTGGRGLTPSPTHRSTLTLTLLGPLGARVLCSGSKAYYSHFSLVALTKPKLHLPRGSIMTLALEFCSSHSCSPVLPLSNHHVCIYTTPCLLPSPAAVEWFTKVATPVEHSSSSLAMLHPNL